MSYDIEKEMKFYLLGKIEKIPKRIEVIGGQNYSYVCLENIISIIKDFDWNVYIKEKINNCKHEFERSPICGNPHYCIKCRTEQFFDNDD